MECIEGFVVVVSDGSKGGDDHESEEDERLRECLVHLTTRAKAKTYSPTQKERWVYSCTGISNLTCDRILVGDELNTPTDNVDGCHEPYKSAEPPMHCQ